MVYRTIAVVGEKKERQSIYKTNIVAITDITFTRGVYIIKV